jgi:hypothetical protein
MAMLACEGAKSFFFLFTFGLTDFFVGETKLDAALVLPRLLMLPLEMVDMDGYGPSPAFRKVGVRVLMGVVPVRVALDGVVMLERGPLPDLCIPGLKSFSSSKTDWYASGG